MSVMERQRNSGLSKMEAPMFNWQGLSASTPGPVSKALILYKDDLSFLSSPSQWCRTQDLDM